MAATAVRAEGLAKRFGDVVALDGFDLEVPAGSVCGLLGPNGAGKTTAVRIFATLLRADSGKAEVGGIDVARDSNGVRRIIGLAGQYAAVDEYLTGRENVIMVGELYHLDHKWVRARADELLERFGLSDAADRQTRTYSGGMRRRLDLAASLVGRPKILFLDEPTTGLDPRSRLDLWEVIEQLVSDGTTVLLTTQYLDEADHLAQKIVVIDHGRVIAEGTSETLKDQVGGDFVEVVLRRREDCPAAATALVGVGSAEPTIIAAERKVSVPTSGGSSVLVEIIRRLDAAQLQVEDLALRRPTLDDVFLALTGRAIPAETKPTAAKGRRGASARPERKES